jgi:hypothetical protein
VDNFFSQTKNVIIPKEILFTEFAELVYSMVT